MTRGQIYILPRNMTIHVVSQVCDVSHHKIAGAFFLVCNLQRLNLMGEMRVDNTRQKRERQREICDCTRDFGVKIFPPQLER